jgi:hypothetical protein
MKNLQTNKSNTSPNSLRDLVGASFMDSNSYLNALPAYNLNAGVDSLLDQSREIQESGKFYYLGVPFPPAQNIEFDPYESMQGSVNIQPYSFLVSISAYSSNAAGFQFSVYDKGAKTYIFQPTQYGQDRIIASNLSITYPNNNVSSTIENPDPNGPYFLTSPLIVLPPGAFQIEMTSMASVNNSCQILFGFAIPLTPKSINVNVS